MRIVKLGICGLRISVDEVNLINYYGEKSNCNLYQTNQISPLPDAYVNNYKEQITLLLITHKYQSTVRAKCCAL